MLPLFAAFAGADLPTHARVAVSAIFSRARPAATARPGLTALELSGTVDDSAPEIDAAFDTILDATTGPALPAFANAAASARAPLALARGIAADGRTLFEVPLYDAGAFHTYVALEPSALESLTRIDLIESHVRVVRTAGSLARCDLEVITVDPEHVLVKWNARDVPVVRVRERQGGPIVAIGAGTTTFSQLSLATNSSDLSIELSDGLHSVARAVHVFGR